MSDVRRGGKGRTEVGEGFQDRLLAFISFPALFQSSFTLGCGRSGFTIWYTMRNLSNQEDCCRPAILLPALNSHSHDTRN